MNKPANKLDANQRPITPGNKLPVTKKNKVRNIDEPKL